MSAPDRQALKEALATDVVALAVALDEAQLEHLVDYLQLIAKWNAVYNLTAIRDPQAMLTQHLVDCLALVPVLRRLTEGRAATVLDVGAGAGLPGIVLALAMPALAVTCIDTVGKKAAFMRQAKGALALGNLSVEEGRVEALAGRFDLIVSRAYASLADFVRSAGHLLAEGGWFVAMKGAVPESEMQALPPEWQVEGVLPLRVPRLDAQRHVVLIGRRSA